MNLLYWWNLIFMAAFALAALYALAYSTLGLGDHDADTSGHVDSDVGDHLDADHSVEHLGEHGQSAEHQAESGLARALGILGVGRVPLAMVVVTFLSVWGATGLAANLTLEPLIRNPYVYFWCSFLVATLAAVFLTRSLAQLWAKLLPSTETYLTTPDDLVGKEATVHLPISDSFGAAMVYDQYKNVHNVNCRAGPGEVLPVGSKVYLTRYDPEKDVYLAMSQKELDDSIGKG